MPDQQRAVGDRRRRGAAQQGHRRRQRVRARSRHPPGRHAEARADLRNHAARIGRRARHAAGARQALRHARPRRALPRARPSPAAAGARTPLRARSRRWPIAPRRWTTTSWPPSSATRLATPLAIGAAAGVAPRRRRMSLKIALLPGDGIGPEVTAEAVRVLQERRPSIAGTPFTFTTHPIGGVAIDSEGTGLPEATLEACLGADAVLLGAVGHPEFDGRLPSERPEAALLALRQALGGFANLRPAMCYAAARQAHAVSARARARRQPADRPRAARRPVLRRAARLRSLGRHRVQHPDLLASRDRARGPRRLRARPRAPQAASPRSTRPTCSRPRGCGARW